MNLHVSAAAHSQAYQEAKPFPHAVLDGVFSRVDLRAAAAWFPDPQSRHWRVIRSPEQVKYTTPTDETLPVLLREFLFWLNSSTVINWLEELTGIRGLIPDPHFDGAGPHMILRGGRLGLHTDYNQNKRLGLHRRVNMLIFLNEGWKEEYGGHLELWSHRNGIMGPQPWRQEARILPTFGRVVVFNTTDFTFHGHPEPLTCPQGTLRRSIAMYYFTATRPKGETWVPRQAGQNTLFLPRPGTGDQDTQRLTRAYLRLVPGWVQDVARAAKEYLNQKGR